MSKVQLRIRHSTVYSQASFSVDREKVKLLLKQLTQLGIEADIFSGQPIPIQGGKELSKEELRKRYMYPSSVKKITGLEESLLSNESAQDFEVKLAKKLKAASKPNLDFLTPSQKERLAQLLEGKVI